MLLAPVVEAGLSECFPYSPEVLKIHRLLEQAVPAAVAQPLPVILALCQDRVKWEIKERTLHAILAVKERSVLPGSFLVRRLKTGLLLLAGKGRGRFPAITSAPSVALRLG